jgi:hypothetical protein
MASISSNNTVGSPGKRGYELLPNATNSYFTALNYHSNSYMANNSGNLFPLSAPFGGVTTAGWRIDSPVTDPVTGLSVPPSYPIIAYYNSGSSACSGRLPGMLKGMSHTAAGLTTFANASEYIVNGQAYQPVLSVSETYPDLFLLLKA